MFSKTVFKQIVSAFLAAAMAAGSVTAFAEEVVPSSAAVSGGVTTEGEVPEETEAPSPVPASAEENTCSFEKLIEHATVVESWSTPVPVLDKKVSVNNKLVMEKDDHLVIPNGGSLRLKNGAELDGEIYIENGGKLIIEKGWVFVRGKIVSDGTIIVYTGGENPCIGGAAVHVSGALYVSEAGQLIEKKSDGTGLSVEFRDRISRAYEEGTIVCLGKTNAEYGSIGKKPVAAVVIKHYPTTMDFDRSEVIVDSIETLYPTAERYFTVEDLWMGNSYDEIIILFENGSILTAVTTDVEETKFSGICGLDLPLAVDALNEMKKLNTDPEYAGWTYPWQ